MQDFGGLGSVAKAFAILEYVGTAKRRSLADIMSAIGLPRSTLLRMIATLVELGFLRRAGHGEYCVTLKLWRIGCNAVDYEGVRDNVIPMLQRLVEETKETSLYTVYDAGQATYVEKVDGLHPIRSYAVVGSHSPAYATATGKALLAWQAEAEIIRVGQSAVQLTDTTLIDVDALLAQAAEIRRTGIAINRGEWRSGVWGIAAPVFGRDRLAVAAIGVTGPCDRIESQMDTFAAAVLSVARELSGYYGALSMSA